MAEMIKAKANIESTEESGSQYHFVHQFIYCVSLDLKWQALLHSPDRDLAQNLIAEMIKAGLTSFVVNSCLTIAQFIRAKYVTLTAVNRHILLRTVLKNIITLHRTYEICGSQYHCVHQFVYCVSLELKRQPHDVGFFFSLFVN
jgi:hypothetical protein